MKLEKGTILGHYEILSKIGEGGMGEVFLALDTKLEREVALKILLAEVADDEDRVRRFVQEAKAASALNHPNILTVYEIGNSDGLSYIATEFIKGRTWRDRMRGEPLSLREVLDVGLQSAAALNAAHEAGIIHRDIKPENIMLRDDGIVKVLDFGLAKLSEHRAIESGSEDATRAQVKTAPGVIMGTVQYMSPEQTRGKATDARSDIWSLGCVLYEMISGKAAFSGETTADVIADIVKVNPKPLTEIDSSVPERLDEIVSKTLEKDANERYQTVKDLIIDLRRLRKKLDLDLELERSHSPSADTSRSGIARPDLTAAFSAETTGNVEPTQNTQSGTQMISTGIRRHKFGAAAVGILIIVILAGFGYGVYRFLSKSGETGSQRTSAAIKTQRLTGEGKAREAVISPDGKFLVYKKAEGEQISVWIKQIQANSNVQVVAAGEMDSVIALTFSPDGNFVYFNGENKDTTGPTIFRVPTLGGSPVKVLTNANALTFSPDGRQVAYLRFSYQTVDTSIFIANPDGSNERKLITVEGSKFFNTRPVWSPDGKLIASLLGDDNLLPKQMYSAVIISVADGKVVEPGKQRWATSSDIVWHPSNDSILVIGSDINGPPNQIWEIGYPNGEARRLTHTLTEFGGISITADGKSIVSTESETKSSVWVSANTDPNVSKQIMPAKGDTHGFGWTPDKRIVYVGDQSGDAEVWIMDQDGSNAKQLTSDRLYKELPVASADGKYIVFSAPGTGDHLIRIDINGGNPLQLTNVGSVDNPDISIDSKWVIYSTWINGKPRIFRVSIDGGEPQQLSDLDATEPRYSNDGKFIACFVVDPKTQDFGKLAIIPAEGGESVKTFDLLPTTNITRGPVWTPDGKGIVYLVSRGERSNLWIQSLDGGAPKQVTNFEQPAVARREYSRDGKQIAIVRGELTSNAVMITDFR